MRIFGMGRSQKSMKSEKSTRSLGETESELDEGEIPSKKGTGPEWLAMHALPFRSARNSSAGTSSDSSDNDSLSGKKKLSGRAHSKIGKHKGSSHKSHTHSHTPSHSHKSHKSNRSGKSNDSAGGRSVKSGKSNYSNSKVNKTEERKRVGKELPTRQCCSVLSMLYLFFTSSNPPPLHSRII